MPARHLGGRDMGTNAPNKKEGSHDKVSRDPLECQSDTMPIGDS